MEQYIKLFFMNLMNSFFNNNVNLKFDLNLELEMINCLIYDPNLH